MTTKPADKPSSKPAAIVAIEPDYQAESDLRTLAEHHKITKDPKRHAAAKELAKQKMVEMSAITKP